VVNRPPGLFFSPLCATEKTKILLICIIKAILLGYEPNSSGLKSFNFLWSSKFGWNQKAFGNLVLLLKKKLYSPWDPELVEVLTVTAGGLVDLI
jgi:hypothetical protein